MSELIISIPKLQSLRQRFASALVTLFFWVVWIYLWLPLVTIIGWFMGIDSVYFQMVELSGYRTLLDKMLFFGVVIAILGGTLAVWAFYNYIRFKGADYRKSRKAVSDQELCTRFKVDEEVLKASKKSSFITVLFNDQGEIEALMPEAEEPITDIIRITDLEKKPEFTV